MSLVIGKPRAVSHSCLVRSAIDMPEELEEEIRNLDEIFVEQLTLFNTNRDFIKKSMKHPIMEGWDHISDILAACELRIREISRGDYFRAMSYGAMRIVNTRMTDVLNAVNPIKEFMDQAIKQEEERIKREAEEEAARKIAEEEAAAAKKAAEEAAQAELERIAAEKAAKKAARKQYILEKGGITRRSLRWVFKRVLRVRPF